MRSVELFAGAGGLAMGISLAGFSHEAIVEWNKYACDTIRENQRRGIKPVALWPQVIEGDVRKVEWSSMPSGIDLVAGGPPCQPFSLGGKHRSYNDLRDMFPATVRTISELRPRAFIIENVKGLLRRSFADYFEYLVLQLTYPELERMPGEDWRQHRASLERHHTWGGHSGLSYRVLWQLLNAADYGVPQRRERVFIVGFREDLGVEWSFPKPTHSQEALLWSQWGTGEYWERLRIPKKERPSPPSRLKVQSDTFLSALQPWRTVRDAISDLPDPESEEAEKRVLNHRLNPGGRPYPGHTGSPFDEPAKTLKAGDHGVPGGENMLSFPNGGVRYFTVREAARLQTFPDDYLFQGSWSECMRQLGNAVPVTLGRVVAESVKAALGQTRPTKAGL